jgi:hypothetical protein
MGEKEMYAGLWSVYLKEAGCMVDLGVDGRIRLNGCEKNTEYAYEGVDWIYLAKDKDKR